MAIDGSVPTIDMFQPLDGWFDARELGVRVKVINGQPGVWCRRKCCGDAAGDCTWTPQFRRPWMAFPDIPDQLRNELTAHIAAK